VVCKAYLYNRKLGGAKPDTMRKIAQYFQKTCPTLGSMAAAETTSTCTQQVSDVFHAACIPNLALKDELKAVGMLGEFRPPESATTNFQGGRLR
jgi:hypothetical protein